MEHGASTSILVLYLSSPWGKRLGGLLTRVKTIGVPSPVQPKGGRGRLIGVAV